MIFIKIFFSLYISRNVSFIGPWSINLGKVGAKWAKNWWKILSKRGLRSWKLPYHELHIMGRFSFYSLQIFLERTSNHTAFPMFSSHIFNVTEVIHTQGDGLSNLLYPLGTIQHIMVNSNFIWSLENRGNNRCSQIIWKKLL